MKVANAIECVVIALLMVACGGERTAEDTPPTDSSQMTQAPSAATPDTPTPATPALPGVSDANPTTVMLMAVRAAVHDSADRIVFEFNGPLPGYKVEYVDRPVTQCGSGDVVELPGDAWLSVRFFPANAHTEAGEPTVMERDQSFSGRNLKRLKLICDFEAVVQWIAAVASPLRYQVLELKAPNRLVIDIEKGN